MNFWSDTFGTNKSKDYIEGMIDGVWAFAINKDGKMVCGIIQKPFKEVVGEIKQQLGWKPEWD